MRPIRSYLFITILAFLHRFDQPFKLFHVILYHVTLHFYFYGPNRMFVLLSPLKWRWLGRCCAAVSLQGRCCRKLFDQIVTMTGKQPGQIHPYADYYTACKSASLSINTRMSNDCFLWFTKRAALMHSSQMSCCSSRCWLFPPGWNLRDTWLGKQQWMGMNGIVCRRDTYIVISVSIDSTCFTNDTFDWLKVPRLNKQITGEGS